MQSQPRKDKSKTTIIIVVVAVILFLIIAGAFLYVDSLGTSGPQFDTPAAVYSKSPVAGGWQINIMQISRTDVAWDDIQVLLMNGTDSAVWDIETADLDGGHTVTAPYAAKALGILSVNLTVTDMSGNGTVNGLDHFAVTASPAFSSTTNYTAVLIFEPTLGRIGAAVTFTG